MKLHLLGTGTPTLDPLRPATSSFLVEAGKDKLLFDAGRGTTMRLLELGTSPVDLDAIFITHLHYDHICDLGELLMAAWHNGRTKPLPIYGADGVSDIVNALLTRVFARDILFTEHLNPDGTDVHSLFPVTNISDTWQHSSDDWSIVAEKVNHGNSLGLSEDVWLCLGYRLEGEGKVLAIGGDSVACEGLSKLARNADALLLSCHLTQEEVERFGVGVLVEHVIASSRQVGKIATEVNVKTLVLTHFRKKSDELMQVLEKEVRIDFSGELHIGKDLLSVII